MTTKNQDRSLISALMPFRRNRKSNPQRFAEFSATQDSTPYHQLPVWRSL